MRTIVSDVRFGQNFRFLSKQRQFKILRRILLHIRHQRLQFSQQLFAADIEFVLIDELADRAVAVLDLIEQLLSTLGEIVKAVVEGGIGQLARCTLGCATGRLIVRDRLRAILFWFI